MIETKDVEDWKIFVKALCWFSYFCEYFPVSCRCCLKNHGITIPLEVDEVKL